MRSLLYLAALLSLLNAVVASPVAAPCLEHSGVDTSDVLPQTGSGSSILNGLSVTNAHNTHHSDSSSINTSGTNDVVNGVVGTQRGGGNILNGVSVDSSKHDSVQHDSAASNTLKADTSSNGVSLGNIHDSAQHDSTKTNSVFHDSVDRESSDSTGLSLNSGRGQGNTDVTGVSVPSLSTGNSRSGSTLGDVISTSGERDTTNRNGFSVGSGRNTVNSNHRDSTSGSTNTKIGNAVHQTTSSDASHQEGSNVTVNPASGTNNNVASTNNGQTSVTTNSVNKDSMTTDDTVTDRSGTKSGSCAL